ncbi:transglutaminase domain-containing protein [Methanobrevibacter sp.]|uniref:transglutaminase domain-containing protein n=1 Tax=Methanobrevibacter sp. TaxID=66852 RepID=UPI00388DC420
MNKRILLAFIVVLSVALSVGTIYASEVNVTDSYSASVDDGNLAQLSVDESDVDDILESENSNPLSTNSEDSDVLAADSSSNDVSNSITAKNVTKYYKGSAKYTATFTDKSGKAVANTNVKIVVNGQTYTKKTDSKGVASLDIDLKPGTYNVVAINPKTNFQLTTTFKILSTISASDISKVVDDSRKFSATFYKSNGKVLANKNVKFKINGKTYTKKTNSNGVAKLSLTILPKGTYKIISYNVDGLKKSNKVTVVKSTTTSLTAKDYTYLKSDTKTLKVKLLNKFGYAPGSGKIIKFKVDGKSYTAKTNSKGVAKLKLPTLKDGIYTVKYKFDGNNYYKASSTSSVLTIIPSKTPTFTVKSTTTFGKGANTPFKVALTSGSVPLANKKVTLTLNNNKYVKTTDSSGIVSLPIDLAVGKYTIKYTNDADSKIDSVNGTSSITVKQRTASTLSWKTGTSLSTGSQNVVVSLVDSSKKAISGATVKLTINSKTYTAKTASNGNATFSLSLSAGSYNAAYSFDGDNLNLASSGSTKLTVTAPKTVTLKEVLAAATSFKNYYDKNNKFPNSVSVGGKSFSVQGFLYIMSEAIYQLGNSKTGNVPYIEGVAAPNSPSGDNINSRDLTQSKYVAVAKSIASYIKTNKMAPNYASSDVGKIIYSEVVDSFSRILAFYNSNNRLPNYVTINYGSGSSQAGSGLNEKNTVSELAIYLMSATHCQVNSSAIKKIVNSVIKGKTTDKEKASAILNYVRDTVSYSFYYNTKYGAEGTLSAKTGNCVDHTHLLIAMFRTAGLPARYVHGTCTFSSGSTYGHVWAQVLVGNTWTVADATSSRNSLGSIVNWNTKSFTLKEIYNSIEF